MRVQRHFAALCCPGFRASRATRSGGAILLVPFAASAAIGAGPWIDFEAEPPAIIGRAAGVDLKIVGISCSLNQEILIRSDSTIKSFADLRGHKVSVPAGTSSHYNVLAILSAAGLSDADVQLVDMSPPDARNAFETGQVDAWAIWPPWVEQEIVAGKGRVIPGGEARIQSIMSVRESFQKDNPAVVQAAFNVLERTKVWIRDNPNEAQQIVANSLRLDRKVIELAWPKHDCSPVSRIRHGGHTAARVPRHRGTR
jgi:sulfonate transport system substrate-binding protein